MGVNLSKGGRVDLTKTNPGLDEIEVGLGWDLNKYDGAQDFDLDVSVFLLDANKKVIKDADFIFYGNPSDDSGSVVHSGDNRTGEGDGPDEIVNVTLSKVPAEINHIAFTITIHEAESRSQNFGQVSNAFIKISNKATGEELISFDLGEEFSVQTAVVAGELYRHSGEWKFAAVSEGYANGLEGLCRDYGVTLA